MTYKNGNSTKEKKETIQRAQYLISKIATSSKQIMDEMPKQISPQFQGEWAIYSCSMTCKALVNIVLLFPEHKENYLNHIKKLIDIVISKELRQYDKERWNEDPLDGINGNKSHLSYYSHLAWMIGGYKFIGGDNTYDEIYHSLCKAMNRRICHSPSMNLPTYPYESIYIPDMLIAIVALSDYAKLYNGKYKETVDKWITKAKNEWLDSQTGLLASFLEKDGYPSSNIRGSYSALNCYYLSLIDIPFAREQYRNLKVHFAQTSPITGIKEYCDKKCMFGYDIDAGPIIFNLSPSGTAFAIGAATTLGDKIFRKRLLRTAEIAGSTIIWNKKRHYLLSNIALVGEAITLALRTHNQLSCVGEAIFCGDVVFKDGIGRYDFADSNYDNLQESIEKVKKTPAAQIYPGHGESFLPLELYKKKPSK